MGTSLILALTLTGQLLRSGSACGPGGCPPASPYQSFASYAPMQTQPTQLPLEKCDILDVETGFNRRVWGRRRADGNIEYREEDQVGGRAGFLAAVERARREQTIKASAREPETSERAPVAMLGTPEAEERPAVIPTAFANGIMPDKINRQRTGYTSNDPGFRPVENKAPKSEPVEPEPEPEADNTGLWVGMGAAFVLVIVGVVVALARKKA